MDLLQKILIDFETHSVEGIQDVFDKGLNPNMEVDGKPLIYQLINMYYRSPRFKECIGVFISNGVTFEDSALLSVLHDNATLLKELIAEDPTIIFKTYSLDCTFTPLLGASLLHICAEYNHVACAKVLLDSGADVNRCAQKDDIGFGGHTPIFHTVNQHNNNSLAMLNVLLSYGADVDMTITGLIWGKGYEWETFIPSVNPISYAMMGLLRQFQRSEKDIYAVVTILMKARYGIDYLSPNIPNRYLS